MNMTHALHAALDHPESFWLAVTALGRDEVFIVLLALYSWLLRPAGMRQLGVAFALSYLANSLLKYGLNLPRPFVADPRVASAAARASAGGPGLPSGHAQLSATLWLGVAGQLSVRQPGRRAFWWVAALVVLLISLSRLVLGVHFPADVLAGLLLGLGFAALAWLPGVRLPWNYWLPILALLLAAVLPAGTPREFPVGLGLFAGFWLLRGRFCAPVGWGPRLGVAAIGLLLVFAVYFGLSLLLPASIRDAGLGRSVRYLLLVLTAGEGVPRLLRFWMPVEKPEAGGL